MNRIRAWTQQWRGKRPALPEWRRSMKVGLLAVALIALGGIAANASDAKPPHQHTAKTVAKPGPKSRAGAARLRHGKAGGPANKGPGVVGTAIKPHHVTAKTTIKPAPKARLGTAAAPHGTIGGPAKTQHGTVGGPVNKAPGITGTGIKRKH